MVTKYMMGRACDGLVRLVLALIRYCKFMISSSPLLRSLVVNDYQLILLGKSIVSLGLAYVT